MNSFALEYLLFVLLMLVLILKTFYQMTTLKNRSLANIVQFLVYTVTLLGYTLLLGSQIGMELFFIIVTFVFAAMWVLEGMQLTRIKTNLETEKPKEEMSPQSRDSKRRQKRSPKAKVPKELSSARFTFVLSGLVFFMTLLVVTGFLEKFVF
jgi:heme O synthase-like polyprenyltransferase